MVNVRSAMNGDFTLHFSRRRFLAALSALGGIALSTGCVEQHKPLSIATSSWPGFKPLLLARQLEWLDPRLVHVLLVEDNELNQEVASELLHLSGLTVNIAENGVEAINALKKQDEAHYDVVLMDMQMPVMDGMTATRELRKMQNLADLPIIAMTANAMVGDRERCLEAGMNDHVAKPIDPEDLWAKLRRWVVLRRAGVEVVSGLVVAQPDKAPVDAGNVLELFAGISGLDVAKGLRFSRWACNWISPTVLAEKPLNITRRCCACYSAVILTTSFIW